MIKEHLKTKFQTKKVNLSSYFNLEIFLIFYIFEKLC